MLQVSDKFKQAIRAQSRMVRAQVTLEVLDTEAWLDNTKAATTQASISRLGQLTNRVRQTRGALASWERDRWRLDGSFVIPPRPEEEPETEIGWWSEALCDADGHFAAAEGITITCGALYNAAGITLAFDPAGNEWARDFTLTVLGEGDSVIHAVTVTDHDSPRYRLERVLPRFYNVEVDITRWSKGHARAKIVEVDFGLVDDYGERNLIDLTIIDETDPTSRTLAAGELRFRLDNSDKRFNILNPQGLHYFLQERQRVIVEMGVDTGGTFENIGAGTYHLTEWKSDPGAMTASFTARDAVDLLAQDKYRRGRLATMSAYDLAADIIDDAKANIKYTIDDALKSIYLLAAVPIVEHREALRLVAQAARAVVRKTKQGELVIEQQAWTEPVASIDLANAWDSPSIKLDPLINAVSVDINGHKLRATSEVYSGAVEVNGTAEIWLEYNNPTQGHQVTVTGATLESAEHFAYASRLVIAGAGTAEITVTADEMERTKTIYTLRDDERPVGEQAYALEVINPLIGSRDVAADVAAWVMAESQRRLNFDANWRQNPALECGDIVTVEDEFRVNRAARIVRQELKYAGYLEGRTGAKGGR